jgi:hypothetical protein
VVACAAALAGAAVLASVTAAAAPVHVGVFNATGIRLSGVVWTGRQFLYVENTTNRLFSGDAKGGPLTPFAKLPKLVEETRCLVAPGGHGFVAGDIYCNIPDNRIYRISADGKTVKLFASLPTRETSDGMLALDTVGRFGFGLVAATGRSGTADSTGGEVFAISAAGRVTKIGDYPGPGGADGVAIAPAGFGSIAGWAVLTVDPGANAGTVVAVSPSGATRTIASLPDGPNPIVILPKHASGAAGAGVYLSDTGTHDVYFISAKQLTPYAGALLVGGELSARLWAISPRGGGFAVREIPTDLPSGSYNLEGATVVP